MLVNLTKDEMSTILYYLAAASVPMTDTDADAKFLSIFEKFEGLLDACTCKLQVEN